MTEIRSETVTVAAMVNPQRKAKPWELGWLAGMIDGEGTITLGTRGTNPKVQQISPQVMVANTHMPTLDRVAELISLLGVGCHVSHGVQAGKAHWKPYGRVECHGFKRVRALLPHVMSYLYTKRPQAELVLAYIDRRIAAGERTTPYTTADYEAVVKIREMNGKGFVTLTDYTRDVDLGTALCRNCGKSFTKSHVSQNYCTAECRDRLLAPSEERECLHCGKKFIPWTNRGPYGQMYCSPACRGQDASARYRLRQKQATKV